MTVIHYHGTPITPRSVLLDLRGRSFCVSFAEPRDVEVCHEIGESVMLDNGAFSVWRRGLAPNWVKYEEWCARWLEHWTTWAVIPDVIDGDEAANDALIARWPHGDRGAPVWHMHESLDRLAWLVSRWPLVCIGSSGEYAKVGDARWHRRMVEAMDIACDPAGVPRTRLHMLRGLSLAGGPYPFYSADSTNVAQNHAGNQTRRTPRKDPVRMALEIDSRQCPPRWHRPVHQLGLGVADAA